MLIRRIAASLVFLAAAYGLFEVSYGFFKSQELAKAEEWMEDLPEDFDPMEFLDGAGGA